MAVVGKAVLNGYGPLLERARDAGRLARVIEWLRPPSALLVPGATPSNRREDPRAHALISGPSLTRSADGKIVFVAWYGSPPSFSPTRLTITRLSAGVTTTEEKSASSLLGARSH
jgi:hypothetical protein